MSDTHPNAYHAEAQAADHELRLAQARFDDALAALENHGGSYDRKEVKTAEPESDDEPLFDPKAKKEIKYK